MTKAIFLTILLCISFLGSSFGQNEPLFSEYDEIIHYHLDPPQKDYILLGYTKLDSIFKSYGGKWVTNKIPKEIPSKLEKQLKKGGFKKNVLSQRQCELFDSIFVQKPVPNEINLTMAMQPYFLDIFILKQNTKIVGLIQKDHISAKHNLIGNIVPLIGFGENYEVSKFMKLLNQK